MASSPLPSDRHMGSIVCIAYDVLLLKAVQEAEAAYMRAKEDSEELPIWMLAHPEM